MVGMRPWVQAAGDRARRARGLAAAAFVLLAACATESQRAVLHFGMPITREGVALYYPPAPEVPRYAYAGELTGEVNFRREGEDTRGWLRRAWDVITGIDSADAPRRVLQRPVAGVSDASGRIYVTDMSRQAVFVFDEPAGELRIWDKALGTVNFSAPTGIALGAGGDLLIADAELGLIARLAPDGQPKGTIGKGLLRRPTGLAYDPQQGLIYVADTHAHDVKVFDDQGGLVQVIGRRGERAGEFNYPTHVAFARGELYVTDSVNSRVQVFRADGEVLDRQFGQRGLYVGNLVRPKGVAVDGEGHVYVVEGYYDHVLVFDGEGRFLMSIGGTGSEPGRFFLPGGVWVDGRERVFVADMFNGRIAVFQFLGGS